MTGLGWAGPVAVGAVLYGGQQQQQLTTNNNNKQLIQQLSSKLTARDKCILLFAPNKGPMRGGGDEANSRGLSPWAQEGLAAIENTHLQYRMNIL
ncbi:hypothetical protein J6590_009640 [Homalodisca vitripennis]|nr:hypothetical protein J6590_009640 [Homalodisca vitripennis]